MQKNHKTLLFLCTGNFYRSRFAEILFNSVAGRLGLSWKASSRGLALELGVNNIGSMSVCAMQALQAKGILAAAETTRFPIRVTEEDFGLADMIIALKQAEHQPLMQAHFPTWAEKIEYWHVDDAPEALDLIEKEIMGLTARLIGGGSRREQTSREHAAEKRVPKNKPVVRVSRETKGRRGKGVTIVSDVPLDEPGLRELAAKLKNKCGTGGTVKDGHIEIQGDQRERLVPELEALGYQVKRAGG